jgi:fatty acyl-CoA reductase
MMDSLDLIKEHAPTCTIATNYPISSDDFTVVNTASEPVVSWINNVYGAAGVLTGAAVGLLKSMNCDKDVAADIVPADMAINAALAIAWEVAQHT